jgi:hypothetical protein
MKYFLLGSILSIIWILCFFGTEIKEKSKPKININIHPFIKNSSLILFNKHIHHWLVFLILFTIIIIIKKMKKNIIYKLDNILNVVLGYSFIQILHGLRYKDRFDFSINE